ncbi:hypothetical protein [Agrococcus sp. DT81.2]|uniref:hypothetical protein n=1 Tax=Agrococcus sp. DT81.2 TaxID=3393414 RepID=UPI003CE538D1
MNTEGLVKPDSDEQRDCRPSPPAGGCDASSTIDQRRCRDKGLTAQLEYSKGHEQALDDAKKTYDQARVGYREKRHEAVLKVQDMKHQVKHLMASIKCLIEQDRVVRCLDDAFAEVCVQLDCCEGPGGCCARDVQFDHEPPPEGENGDRKLGRRIERYKDEIAKAKACFETLAGEPAALSARVDDVKRDLDAIQAALADDAAKVDLKKQYASALIAKRKLAHVWNGFDDTTAYVDCLCHALNTWSAGVDAVSLLIAVQAMRACAKESEQEWCRALIGGPVAEILVVYDRLCSSDKPCGIDQPEGLEEEHPDDCGCGKHHGQVESAGD